MILTKNRNDLSSDSLMQQMSPVAEGRGHASRAALCRGQHLEGQKDAKGVEMLMDAATECHSTSLSTG